MPWLLHTLAGHQDFIRSVAISPDNSFIVTGSEDATAKIWYAKTGQLVHTLNHQDKIRSVAISSDNSFIVTGSPDTTAKIWDREPKWLRLWINQHMTLPQALLLNLLLGAQKAGIPISLRLLAQKNGLDPQELDTVFTSIAGPDNRFLHVRNFFVKFFDLKK